MKKFLACFLLICAPAYAVDSRNTEDFQSFMKRYVEFRQKRDAEEKNPTARFIGNFSFLENGDCAISGLGDSTQMVCPCPPGNQYLQCLDKTSVTIVPDRMDLGGTAYVMAIVGDGTNFHVLGNGQRWIPQQSFGRGNFSAKIAPLSGQITLDLPVPPRPEMEQMCASGGTYSLTVGYGAVMPMDIEYAARLKQFGDLRFSPDDFMWQRARMNGFRPRKSAVIGTFACRRPAEGNL